jgi:hypothetical protein
METSGGPALPAAGLPKSGGTRESAPSATGRLQSLCNPGVIVMSEEPLSEPLESRGFRPIETALPGDWATNVRMSIQITSERDVDRRRTYVARVYDAPAHSLELPRVQLLAESQSDDHVEATRLALEGTDV